MNVFDEFQWRGLVYDSTEGLRESLENEKITAYIGFDPTAPSLHAGNLLTIMGLVRLQTLRTHANCGGRRRHRTDRRPERQDSEKDK